VAHEAVETFAASIDELLERVVATGPHVTAD